MKCTFVAIGAENISLQVLSAMLKQHGHTTELAYDQALFDDKNYLYKPRLAKLFDHKNTVLQQVLDSHPDLVGFSVMTPTYPWAIKMAAEIKRHLDVPIIFGGIHPTVLPEQTLSNDCIDIVCRGEGDYALLDLCNSIEAGEIVSSIPNLWFKHNGEIIRNDQRPLIEDLDALPLPDKELFAPHVPIRNYYLAVTTRGCPFACTFCSLSYQANEIAKLGGPRLRERSVDSVIHEIALMRQKYGFQWIDFRNNTFTSNRRWVFEFCEKYKKSVGLPFKIFAHPMTVNDEVAARLKDAGCFGVQLGVESYSESVRADILNRHESNEQIREACTAFDKAGLPYSLDYILGLPSQAEEELVEAAKFFIECRQCYRISPFMLEYLPRLEIIQHGLACGDISQKDVDALERGEHNHYLSTGSVGRDPKKLRFFMQYRLLFRMIPFLPSPIARFLVKSRMFRAFNWLPTEFFLNVIDVIMVFRRRDRDAKTYMKNYWYWIRSRFDSRHPAFRKRTKPGASV